LSIGVRNPFSLFTVVLLDMHPYRHSDSIPIGE